MKKACLTSADIQSAYENRTFGRRHGHRLSPAQKKLVSELLPRLSITAADIEGGLEPKALFAANTQKIWLEIGFGGGEHLAWQVAQHKPLGQHTPMGIIGCEPYRNGMAKLLSQIDAEKLENIRLYDGDAREVLAALPRAALDRVFLLFPDPWPKKRHLKRRFVTDAALAEIARVLKPGGVFRFASDIPGYVRWTLVHMTRQPDFCWTAKSAADWRTRPNDWPETRYEQKARQAGRKAAYLTFRRI